METTAATTAFVLAMDVVLALAVLALLRRGGASRRTLTAAAAASALWIGALFALVQTESLFPADLSGIGLFAALLAGVAATTGLAYLRPIREALWRAPFELVMATQGLRVFFGAGFLVEAVLGVMPAGFGIADGVTHISAAFLALALATAHAMGAARPGFAWFVNAFGLLDIVVVAGGISFVLLPEIGPHQGVMLAAFFAAPIFIALHFVAIHRIVAGAWRPAAPGRAAALAA